MEEAEARRLFERLKIRTLLDLALCLPASYEDTRLSDALIPGRVQTFEATVRSRRSRPGRMQVEFWLPALDRSIMATFFRVTPYHHRLFEEGSRHVIQGKVTLYRGLPQIVQPRSLKEYGTVLPRYKTSVSQEQMRALVAAFVTEHALYSEGLESREVQTLLKLHFPQSHKEDISAEYDAPTKEVLKFVEAYNHLRKLRGKRIDYPALQALEGPVEDFIDGLPFELTPDQRETIETIRQDLRRRDRAARRLIVGDVGSGKTVVMLAAAAAARPAASLLMAPTSILALQLYEEACRYLPEGMSTALVTQNRKEGDPSRADLVVGTHGLLYREDLPEAALVMVDEQHRFGTRQRSMLEAMVSRGDRRPHFLQFSATPIPRTQAMMESELIDLSLLTTMPFERRVQTRVVGREDFPEMMEHIRREVQKGHQVLIIYPLVEESGEVPYQSIEEARSYWEERFEGVYVTHGRDRLKEEALENFRERGTILLATTVVEVGISLPRLSTIVVVGAERLGLATLHQLRGRVGRHGIESRCYLFTHAPRSERLQAFARTESGFEIARLDLKFRESGDILDGTIQSGQKFRWLDLAEDERIVSQAKARVNNWEKMAENG